MVRWQYYAHNVSTKGAFVNETDSAQVTNAMNYFANDGWEFMNAVSTVGARGARITITLFFRRRV